MINPNRLCPNCMKDWNNPSLPCPNCGFQWDTCRLIPRALSPFSILAGRYLMGLPFRIGEYEILYAAMDMTKECTVAIKEFFPDTLADRRGTLVTAPRKEDEKAFQEALENFQREARILSRFSWTDAIVAYHDFLQENGTSYLVMDYIPGPTLKQVILERQITFSREQALQLMRPILQAVGVMHRNGVLHGAVCPENLILKDDGALTLIGFESAIEYHLEEYENTAIALNPENAASCHSHQGPWMDLYACREVVDQMVSGMLSQDSDNRNTNDFPVPPKDMQETTVTEWFTNTFEQEETVSPEKSSAAFENFRENTEDESPQPEEDLQQNVSMESHDPLPKPDKKKIFLGTGVALILLAFVMGGLPGAGVAFLLFLALILLFGLGGPVGIGSAFVLFLILVMLLSSLGANMRKTNDSDNSTTSDSSVSYDSTPGTPLPESYINVLGENNFRISEDGSIWILTGAYHYWNLPVNQKDSDIQPNVSNTYTYKFDAEGRVLERIQYQKGEAYSTTWSYEGDIVTEIDPHSTTYHTYKNGQIQKKSSTTYSDNKISSSNDSEYIYNNDGSKTRIQTYHRYGENPYSKKIISDFSAEGKNVRLLTETTMDDGTQTRSEEIVSDVNEYGDPLIREQISYEYNADTKSETSGTIMYLYEYEYAHDSEGNMIYKKETLSKDIKDSPISVYETTYDSYENKLTDFSYKKDSSESGYYLSLVYSQYKFIEGKGLVPTGHVSGKPEPEFL